MGRHAAKTTSIAAKLALGSIAVGTASALLAPTASAASDADWDALAQCESGGNWTINNGNGFQGGLQFSPSTWTAHGGQEFAPTADQASREQQIVVAERVLASQGWGAWPACSSQLGLNSPATERTAPAAPAPASTPDVTPVSSVSKAETPATGLNDLKPAAQLYSVVSEALAKAEVPVPAELTQLLDQNIDNTDAFYAAGIDIIKPALDYLNTQETTQLNQLIEAAQNFAA